MEQCPIKEMEINFQCVMDTENSLFEPIPAKKVKPEWYKKLPSLIEDAAGNRLDTIKRCPAMHDWLSMGYLIRNRHTVLVSLSKGKDGEPVSVGFILKDMSTEKLSYIKTLAKENKVEEIADYLKVNKLLLQELSDRFHNIGGHPAKQVTGMSRDDKMQIKFKMDFLIETPKGTSCYYLDPFLFDNPYFSTWQGVIDTDKFNQITTNNNLIFYPKVDESFIIPKGTPLVQIVPFVRYPWKSKVTYLTKEEIDEKMVADIVHGELKDMNQRDIKKGIDEPYYVKRFKSRKEYS
tara:strand:- start:731 stop:1606 length:876 start_codon:yes stop_codon:yes gene_type:complete